MPESVDEWKQISAKFEDIWNFPNCVGAIDGKHVVLQAPINSASDFYNYKSQFSIVLVALVDADYNFIFVDVGAQGRISDGGVFKNCKLYERLENGNLNLPSASHLTGTSKEIPYVILGDSAFPLSNYLMKPYPGIYDKGSPQRIFNYRLSRARRVVENAFGIISSVFRVLRKPMLLQPDKADLIVMAIIHLHNFLRKSRTSSHMYTPPGYLDGETEGELIPGAWRSDRQGITSFLDLKNVPRRTKVQPKEIREELTKYFCNQGAVPWQCKYA